MSYHMKVSTDTLLEFLASVLKKHGDISLNIFDSLENKPVHSSTYLRRFSSWNAAKGAAGTLLHKKGLHVKEPDTKVRVEGSPEIEKELLAKKVRDLRKTVAILRKERMTDEEVRAHIFELKESDLDIPNWILPPDKKRGVKGVPSLLISDWHFGETVDPEQVFGRNKFNLGIGMERVRRLAENTVKVLNSVLFKKSDYPGLVLLLAGDFISGNIHEELTATNDEPLMPSFLKVLESLIWFIRQMAESFNNLMIFGVSGNHTRTTKRIPAKNKAYTSYDWLLYQLLEKWFEDDKNINFRIAVGDDVQFKIYNHRYRMTHGDQFRGGAGFIGPYAPITRGEIKKRSAAETYGQNYDTLIIGHFHQRMHLTRVIVNGSLVGYNEYALKLNFPFEVPQQALWITHPRYGVTIDLPVFCDEKAYEKSEDNWVS